MMDGVTDSQGTTQVKTEASARVASGATRREVRLKVMLAVVMIVLLSGFLGWEGVREARKQRGALKMMREAVESSLAPDEMVVVDDRLLGWALRRGRDGMLRQNVWTVREDVPVSSLLAQMEMAKRREMLVVATPDDRLIQDLDAAGFSVAQEVGWVPWDLKGRGWGLLGRGKMRIYFAVAPRIAVASKTTGTAKSDGAVSSESK